MFRNEVKYRVSFLLLTEHVTLDISMSILIVNISKILFYDKYDISEGMDVNDMSVWRFLSMSFSHKTNVWNKSHDLMVRPLSFTEVTTMYINDIN